MPITKDKIKGCLLGCAYGDAMGANFEGGFLEHGVWKLIGTSKGRMRYTDDTQMTLDIVRSILSQNTLDQDHLAQTFANSYRWSRGYGPGAAKTLKQIRQGMPWNLANVSQYKEGSFGNGAAMRAPALALFYPEDQLKEKVTQASIITHAHPEAIEGAWLVALTCSLAFQNTALEVILKKLLELCELKVFQDQLQWLGSYFSDEKSSPAIISQRLGNGMQARNSCVTAIAYALHFRNSAFLEMFGAIKRGKGDVDTIAAMAGAIWGGFNGYQALPDVEVESKELILDCAEQIFEWQKTILS